MNRTEPGCAYKDPTSRKRAQLLLCDCSASDRHAFFFLECVAGGHEQRRKNDTELNRNLCQQGVLGVRARVPCLTPQSSANDVMSGNQLGFHGESRHAVELRVRPLRGIPWSPSFRDLHGLVQGHLGHTYFSRSCSLLSRPFEVIPNIFFAGLQMLARRRESSGRRPQRPYGPTNG